MVRPWLITQRRPELSGAEKTQLTWITCWGMEKERNRKRERERACKRTKKDAERQGEFDKGYRGSEKGRLKERRTRVQKKKYRVPIFLYGKRVTHLKNETKTKKQFLGIVTASHIASLFPWCTCVWFCSSPFSALSCLGLVTWLCTPVPC